MRFLETLKRLYGMHNVDWWGYHRSQREEKPIKPKYPNAAQQVEKNGRKLEKRRAEARAKMLGGKVVELKRRKAK